MRVNEYPLREKKHARTKIAIMNIFILFFRAAEITSFKSARLFGS